MTQDNETGGAGTPGRVRASDAERERVVEQLREHFEAGRLDAEEFNERMEAAFAARFRDELPALLADLPDADRGAPAEGEPAGAPGGRRPGWGGGPPWMRAEYAGLRAWRRGPFPPLLPLLAVFAVVASLGAIAHGHFPFLLWLGVALWWFRPWDRRRHGRYGRPAGKASTTASRS